MAKLTNLDTFKEINWIDAQCQRVKVGNNRAIEYYSWSQSLCCFLHDANIISATMGVDGITICLDTCGWLTTTTIAAMNDFMFALGLRAKASRANGVLSIRWRDKGEWREHTNDTGNTITFTTRNYYA